MYSQSEVITKIVKKTNPPAPLPDEFRIYDDKAIHGWLEKQGKGYFASSKWKRLYVIVENQKLCYYADKSMMTHKGVLDFSKIRAKLSVSNESTFKVSVQIKGGAIKEFTFRTISKGSLATWITLINMQMSNAEVQAASEMLQMGEVL